MWLQLCRATATLRAIRSVKRDHKTSVDCETMLHQSACPIQCSNFRETRRRFLPTWSTHKHSDTEQVLSELMEV